MEAAPSLEHTLPITSRILGAPIAGYSVAHWLLEGVVIGAGIYFIAKGARKVMGEVLGTNH